MVSLLLSARHALVHVLRDRSDLHTRNIFFRAPDLYRLSTDELYERFGTPNENPVTRLDGGPLDATVPSHAIPPLWVGKVCEDVTETDLMIADFGEAYIARDTSPETLNTHILLCPPEHLLKTESIGMPADIWTLACTLFEVLGDSHLFEGFCPDEDAVMCEHVSALGKPSEDWWKAWENRGMYFNEDGSWVPAPRRHSPKSRPLEMRIAQMGRGGDEGFTKAEQDALLRLLKGMLAYDPKERFKIVDVVHSEWMEKFGRPAMAVSGIEAPLQSPTEAEEAAIAATRTEMSLQSSTKEERPAIAAIGTEGSLQSSTEVKKPATSALGNEGLLPSSTETEKPGITALGTEGSHQPFAEVEKPATSAIGTEGSLGSSTNTAKSPYERLLEGSKDLEIERLETPTESSPTRTEKSANENTHEGAKNLKVERLETPTELSSTETEKSPYERLLKESQDLKTERLETPAESSTTKIEKSPNEDSPEEAKNLEVERIVTRAF